MASNGKDIENGNGNEADVPKMDKDAAGAAPVKTKDGEQEVDFKTLTAEEAFQVLGVTKEGLTTAEHAKRLEEYGPNKLPESTRNPFLVYLGYMWNPLSWAMEVAAILAIILLDYPDFCLILALLVMNATISYREEASADKAIKALAAALAPKARAIRDGKLEQIESSQLVPGDVILIAIGNVVPADVKLLGEEGDDVPMQVDQAALTGESLPAKKFAGDVAFSGSTIKQGEKHALVYATGQQTFFGRAASLLAGTHNVANLQKIMTRIGGVCLVTIGIWCIIELAVQFGHYGHSCKLGSELCPTLTNMLVIIVGGIPIAMPTVLSVTLALGAYKLAKEGAIVARMSAVEEMAGMDILCSDKTGTLTLNELTVDKPNVLVTVPGMPVDEALILGALSANISSEEPIDMVMHESAPGHETLWERFKQIKFVPFNPTDKYTIGTIKPGDGSETFRLMKGAPQVVLRRCNNVDRALVEGKITEYAGRGYRALGLARAKGEGGVDQAEWEFVCLLPLFDPPRHDTKETIERCREKGIDVKMVTGDQLLIGKETSRQLGMGTDIKSTEALLEHVEDEKKLGELVEGADGFAEVFPEHKFEIVAILQRRNHMVGMTGDGVNDAPALKKADVGIAVDGATDAARGAADIVLTEPGLSVIVTAIIGARKIFQRMTTYSKYTVAMTFRICFTFGLLTVLYNFYFPTVLIVLLAVFNDGAMIALSKDKVVASRLPNHWALKSIFITGIVYGLYLTLSSWVLYYVATHTSFFRNSIKMHDLRYKPDNYLAEWCLSDNNPNRNLILRGPLRPATTVYPTLTDNFPGNGVIPTVLAQCQAEQRYVRESMTRTLMYAQVSFSGQAVVFVVRTAKHSLTVLAGRLTYIAYFAAQAAALLIAALGFNGYAPPAYHVDNCLFCQYSSGGKVFGFPGTVPIAGTESQYTASVIGCTYYIIVAVIWSIIWYFGLDPIKWAMMYILNEDGFRDLASHKVDRRNAAPNKDPNMNVVSGMGGGGYGNPLGRASVTGPIAPPGEGQAPALARASVVGVKHSSMGPAGPALARSSITRSSMEQPAVKQ